MYRSNHVVSMLDAKSWVLP